MRWFWQKKQGNPQIFTEEQRAASLETRRLKAQVGQLEKRLELKQHIEGLTELANGGSSNKMEEMMLSLLMGALMKSPQTSNNIPAFLGAVSYPPDSSAAPIPINEQKIDTAVSFLAPKLNESIKEQLRNFSDAELIEIKNRLI
jgi:hypothetical protein